jgi:hypothetical protein
LSTLGTRICSREGCVQPETPRLACRFSNPHLGIAYEVPQKWVRSLMTHYQPPPSLPPPRFRGTGFPFLANPLVVSRPTRHSAFHPAQPSDLAHPSSPNACIQRCRWDTCKSNAITPKVALMQASADRR